MRRIAIALYGGVLALALTLGTIPSFAADIGVPSSGEITPSGPYQEGLPIGAWMFYPSVYAGVVYDDNFHQAASGTERDSGASLLVSPRLVATHTDGAIHSTTLFGVGDFQFFNANTVAADAGFTHTYKPLPDLAFNLNFRYTRETDLFTSALNFNNNAIGLHGGPTVPTPTIINPFGTTPSVNPVAYNQFTAGGSVQKTFDQAFVAFSANAFHIAYDHADNILPPFNVSHDGTSLWLTGRAGYHFIPGVYAFAEASGIWQRFNNSLFDTNGYRVTGGIGDDDPGSLIHGEVYGGYQFQHQEQQNVNVPGLSQDSDSGVFGGRMLWSPTPYWTWVASVDELLGMSTMIAPNIPQGVPALTTTAILQTTYGLSQQWSVGARVGYTRADYFDIDRLDNGWMAGASFNYEIWRNLLLTLDYQHSTNNSNVAFNDFSRNVYSAGLTYKY